MRISAESFTHFAMAGLLMFVGACGQTLSIKVERIRDANVEPYIRQERMKDDEPAPRSAREAAAELSLYTKGTARELNLVFGELFAVGATNRFTEIATEAEENYRLLTDYPRTMTVGELRQRVAQERARLDSLRQFREPEVVFVPIFRGLGLDAAGVDAKLKELQRLKKTRDYDSALKSLDSSMMRVDIVKGELDNKLKYGGFRSDSIFLINPGSREYEMVMADRRRQRPQLVFSKVEAIASGNSILLAVQENPAYFTMRYVSANPTEVIRNMLIATNRILRVAAAFVPAVQGVGAALGSVKPPLGGAPATPATPSDSTSVDGAEAAIAAFDEALKNLEDEELKALIRKLKTDPASLTAEDKARLLAKVEALRAVLGGAKQG